MKLLAKGFINSFLFLNLILLSGCRGYQFGNSELSECYSSIAVPYAENDFDGSFTTELIRQVVTSGVYEYTRTGADLLLKVRLLDFDTDNVGFRYYKNKHDKLTSETIPVETRFSVIAEVTLIDRATGKTVLPTVRISAFTDFDHDYYSTKNNINVESLGQLTDYDEALDAADKPLYFNLSKKIVDYISDAW
jgi:hypothetical protein